jgi:hypothetical protein
MRHYKMLVIRQTDAGHCGDQCENWVCLTLVCVCASITGVTSIEHNLELRPFAE